MAGLWTLVGERRPASAVKRREHAAKIGDEERSDEEKQLVAGAAIRQNRGLPR
jgi:hypothetical protein